jgi:hypothetical protein
MQQVRFGRRVFNISFIVDTDARQFGTPFHSDDKDRKRDINPPQMVCAQALALDSLLHSPPPGRELSDSRHSPSRKMRKP